MPTHVRPETLEAWDALTGSGEAASVRKVCAVVGGTYGRVADECRILTFPNIFRVEPLWSFTRWRAVSTRPPGRSECPGAC